MAFESGPYVQAACFCENILRDVDGTTSLIKIIDTLTHTVANPDPPENLPPFPYTFNLALLLKSGTVVGRHEIKIVPEVPTGETKTPQIQTVHFEGEEKGCGIIMKMTFIFEHEGLYWFDIFFDDEKQKLTSIPLRVKYNRQFIKSGTSAPAEPE